MSNASARLGQIFKVDDKEYTARMTFLAMAGFEEDIGKPFLEWASDILPRDGDNVIIDGQEVPRVRMPMKDLLSVLYRSLVAGGHDITHDEAGEIADALGPIKVMELAMNLIAAAFGDQEDSSASGKKKKKKTGST